MRVNYSIKSSVSEKKAKRKTGSLEPETSYKNNSGLPSSSQLGFFSCQSQHLGG
jgi:hypothetical protein